MRKAIKVWILITAGIFLLITALIMYLLKASAPFIIVFYSIVLAFVILSVIVVKYFGGMKEKTPVQSESVTVDYSKISRETEEYMLLDAAVEIGEVFKRGTKKWGAEGEAKTPIFLMVFKDKDSSDVYAVGVNMLDTQNKNWEKLPSKRSEWDPIINSLLDGLSESNKEYRERRKTKTDDFGNTVEEIERVPFYREQGKKEEEEGDF